MPISIDLTGRRLLVTGASSGIGEVTRRARVGCGASIATLARRNRRLTALSAELGRRALGIQCDGPTSICSTTASREQRTCWAVWKPSSPPAAG